MQKVIMSIAAMLCFIASANAEIYNCLGRTDGLPGGDITGVNILIVDSGTSFKVLNAENKQEYFSSPILHKGVHSKDNIVGLKDENMYAKGYKKDAGYYAILNAKNNAMFIINCN